MVNIEEQVTQAMQQQGWNVLRSGWPDLLCYRQTADGKPEILAIECKDACTGDKLRPAQIKNHLYLNAAGVKVVIIRHPEECSRDLIGAASHSIEQHSQELIAKIESRLPKLEKETDNFNKALEKKRKFLIEELDKMEARYRTRIENLVGQVREMRNDLAALAAKTVPTTEPAINETEDSNVQPERQIEHCGTC